MRNYISIAGTCSVLALICSPTLAYDGAKNKAQPVKVQQGDTIVDSVIDALKSGKPHMDVRYRYETVEQDNRAERAHASTIRTRVGYTSAEFEGFSFLVEGEDVSEVGADNYNNTVNNKSDHPNVVDVEGTEVNRAYVQYKGLYDSQVRFGRQYVMLDNQRFFGWVDWRQNNQSFDGVTFKNTALPDTVLQYGYINNVNRIFGENSTQGDFDSDTHYVNVSNESSPLGKITAYSYWIDLENDSALNSNQTFGASLKGKVDLGNDFKFHYYGEAARQTDYGENTVDYDADYFHIKPGVSWKTLWVWLGYEELGADSSSAGRFRTPLATGHKFNGWADIFLTTPENGLEDMYIAFKYKVKGYEGIFSHLNGSVYKLAYHDFSANEGSADYGTEWNAFAKFPIKKHFDIHVKYSNYDADEFSTDTEKLTVGVGFKF